MQEMNTETRLDGLERHAERTEGRLSSIEKVQAGHTGKLDNIGDKLDSVLRSVAVGDAARAAVPKFNGHEWVRSASAVAGVFALLAALLIWVIVRMTEADTRVINTKLEYHERQIDFIRQMSTPTASVSTHVKGDK